MGLKRHNNPRGIPGTNAQRTGNTSEVKRAQAEMDEAAVVAGNSLGDSVREEALTDAIERYRALCEQHGVCVIRNCQRRRWADQKRCKSHSVNYAGR